jgi:methionine-rich copper-binding protein CopC
MNDSRLKSLLYDVLRAGLMTAIAVTLVLVLPRVASAHAVLMQSSPAIDATVQGPDVPITMKFNSRVDGSRSTLLLRSPDGQSKPLTVEKQAEPETLTAHASQRGNTPFNGRCWRWMGISRAGRFPLW